MRIVLDASVAVSAVRSNEPFHAASRARVSRVFSGADTIVVPALFFIEVGSALARAGESLEAARTYVGAFHRVAERIVTIGPKTAMRMRDAAMSTLLRAADATYAWTAAKEGVPLCTLDRELRDRGCHLCSIIGP